jgi:hypothetical protein
MTLIADTQTPIIAQTTQLHRQLRAFLRSLMMMSREQKLAGKAIRAASAAAAPAALIPTKRGGSSSSASASASSSSRSMNSLDASLSDAEEGGVRRSTLAKGKERRFGPRRATTNRPWDKLIALVMLLALFGVGFLYWRVMRSIE